MRCACRFRPWTPPAKEALFTAIRDDGLGVAPTDARGFEAAAASLMARGASREAAETELRREMANDYRRLGRGYHIVQPGLITISFGRVSKG